MIIVKSEKDMLLLMDRGAKNRSTGPTAMNNVCFLIKNLIF